MRISEIFTSVNGEVNVSGQGSWTTFIRLQGCNLKCKYCDAPQAQDPTGGMNTSPTAVRDAVIKAGSAGCFTITGGEPMLQWAAIENLWCLIPESQTIIETNGTFPLPPAACNWIVDCKLPSSGYGDTFNPDVYQNLRVLDFVKMVIADEEDYNVAWYRMNLLQNTGCKARFAFSPVHGVLKPETLMQWMRRDKLYNAVLNVQLHKYIGVK